MTLSGWEAVFFWIFAVAALMSAMLMVLARNTVHSALFLISSLVAVAALFVLLGAEFIAGVQILIYVGGVMVLFLFVVMLVNVSAEEVGTERLYNGPAQVAAGIFFCFLLAGSLLFAINRGYAGLQNRDAGRVGAASASKGSGTDLDTGATGTMRITRDTERVGASLYRFAGLPFEIASVLLLVAIVGSVMLARTERQEAASGDLDSD